MCRIVIGGDRIERRQVSAAILGDVLRGDVEISLCDPHLQAGRGAVFHPVVHVVGHRQLRGEARANVRDFRGSAANDLPQRLFLDFEIVLRGDFLRDCEVMPRLRVVGVRDCGGTDFEVAFRLRQLLGERGFLGRGEQYVVFCEQNVEVRLRNPEYQVLVRLQKSRFRLRDLVFGLLVGNPVLVAKERLRRGHGHRIGVIRGIAADQTGCRRAKEMLRSLSCVFACTVTAGSNSGQTLRQFFLAGHVARARRGVNCVRGLRFAIDRQQIGRRCSVHRSE